MAERDHYLHGADDVRAASHTMSNAAEHMRSAAGSFDGSVDRLRNVLNDHETFLSDWLLRFEAAMRGPSPIDRPIVSDAESKLADERVMTLIRDFLAQYETK